MPFIEGYLNTLSAAPGETVQLHASSNSDRCTATIIREGYPERVVHIEQNIPIEEHPIPGQSWLTGPGWPVCWTFTVPRDWTSGVYRIELSVEGVRNQPTHTHWGRRLASQNLLLVVRAARPAEQHNILLQLTTNTSIAYNSWGGRSLYAYNSFDKVQSARVSLLRPGHGYYDGCPFPAWERPFVHWCEREGYGLDYAINYDLERWPDGFDQYRLILSVGHDEYWSAPMRDHLERFIANGGNAAFFSGNSVCWQVRFEDEGKTMVSYKEHYKQDPKYASGEHALLSTLWSHPLVGRPENRLTGVGFPMGGYHLSHGSYMDGLGEYTVRRAAHWVFEGTCLTEGDVFGGRNTIVGYETDGCAYVERDGYPVPTGTDGTPEGFTILAQCPSAWAGHEIEADVFKEARVAKQGMATMGLYTRGGTVFTAGTTDWSHGLKDDSVVQQITRNVLNRLGT